MLSINYKEFGCEICANTNYPMLHCCNLCNNNKNIKDNIWYKEITDAIKER